MNLVRLISYLLALLLGNVIVLSPLRADIVLDFNGNHPAYGPVKVELRLKDSYQFGTPLTAHNMIKLTFNSNKQQYSIEPKEITDLIAGFNSDGSLLHTSGNYQFYMNSINNKFFGARVDGSWRFNNDLYEGNLGQWTVRTEPFDTACLQNNNFHKAAARGDLNYVEQCLKAGINVNAKEVNGWTALHSAAWNGRIGVARLLIRHGANKTSTDVHGRTPRDLAARAKQHDMVAVLDNE